MHSHIIEVPRRDGVLTELVRGSPDFDFLSWASPARNYLRATIAPFKAAMPPTNKGSAVDACSHEALTVTATTKAVLERELDRAVSLMRKQAIAEGLHGILVTHVAPGISSVSVSATVPHGLTREVHSW